MMTLGIDPGVTGALAVYDGRNVRCFDMPFLILKKGKSEKRRIDRPALFDLVTKIAAAGIDLAAVEDVGGVMGQSASASAIFGKAAGYVEMAVIGNRIPILDVPPATWKGALRLKGGKDAARALACNLIPAGRHYWARKRDDGRAESALLALYAYRQLSASAP